MAASFALACGGEPRQPVADTTSASATSIAAGSAASSTSAATSTSPSASPAVAAPITGTTHEVKMLGDAKGYRFEPAALTIKPGDGVKWIMVSGGPHNVTFWPDSVPSGAPAQLQAAMPNQMSPLTGPLLTQQNETYTISFAGAKTGTYHYYCTPHLALGMKATITVQ
jgi:plastocyanin